MVFNLHYTKRKFRIPSDVTELKLIPLDTKAIRGSWAYDTYLKRLRCGNTTRVLKIPIQIKQKGTLYTLWDRVPYVDICIGRHVERIYDTQFLQALSINPTSIPCLINENDRVFGYLVVNLED